jgi:hypothetical protein
MADSKQCERQARDTIEEGIEWADSFNLIVEMLDGTKGKIPPEDQALMTKMMTNFELTSHPYGRDSLKEIVAKTKLPETIPSLMSEMFKSLNEAEKRADKKEILRYARIDIQSEINADIIVHALKQVVQCSCGLTPKEE